MSRTAACSRHPRRRRPIDEPHPGHRSRHRELPGGPVPRGRHPGRDRPARVDPRRPARRARIAGLRHGTQLGRDRRVHPRGAGSRGHRPDRRRGREQHEHARGHGAVRRRRPGDLGLPQRRLARLRGGRDARRERRRPATLRPGRRLGVDHVPGPVPLDPGARAGHVPADRPPRDAQRLGPLPADRPVRHGPVVRLQLEPVRPPRRGRGRRRPSRSSACRRTSSRPCSSPGRWSGR